MSTYGAQSAEPQISDLYVAGLSPPAATRCVRYAVLINSPKLAESTFISTHLFMQQIKYIAPNHEPCHV